ncbi:MAG: hypothetical protein QGI44_01640 [Candidatus Marinimicrobia bacterium]|nr:hypothetical protein [Candidatus Neomarinimicrobiota bacterium]
MNNIIPLTTEPVGQISVQPIGISLLSNILALWIDLLILIIVGLAVLVA